MAGYSQAHQALAVVTPLGPDVLLLEKVSGFEAIGEPFRFQLQMLARAPLDFGKVVNQWATVRLTLPNGSNRHVNGIISRLSQGGRVTAAEGAATFIRYTADLVPALWRLTKRVRSRIFQNVSVPAILKTVLGDEWRLELSASYSGTYQPRNYCVQHCESDFAFVSRLMEDEGITYYFTHSADSSHRHDKHVLVLTDHPAGHEDLPGVVHYQEQGEETPHVWEWEKTQELPSGLHSLSDYHFEVPSSRLEAQASVAEKLAVGRVSHPLRFPHAINGTEVLETREFPGGYAHRFDDIDPNGQARGKEIEKLHEDSRRVARLRAEEAAAWSLTCTGAGSCGHFLPGHCFTLAGHFDADDRYLLTRVEQVASIEGCYVSGGENVRPSYENRFRCVPAGLPFRPRRLTPKPRIDGVQTATVTGPKGSAIAVDLYGRVKVKFRWEAAGTDDASSSCWVRVAQPWAGPRYGAFFWPRPGHEVVVAFENGDPDRPLITGSVYNDANMPPFGLPGNQSMTGIKSCSLGGNPITQSSWLVFHDEPEHEHFHLHSETHEVITSGSSKRQYVPGPHVSIVGHSPMAAASGSGGGGGHGHSLICSAFPPPGSGAGGGICDGLDLGLAITGQTAPSWLATYENLFPGAFAYTAGSKIDSVLLGDRVVHVLAGADVRLVFDLETLLGEAATEIPGVGAALTPFYGGGLLSAALIGAGGTNNLTIGPNTRLNYWGPKVSITRGETVAYKTRSKNPGALVLAFLGLTTASAIAADVVGRIFSLKEKSADDEAKKQEAREKIAEQKEKDAEARKDRAAEQKKEAGEAAEKAAEAKQKAQDIIDDPEATAEQKEQAEKDKQAAETQEQTAGEEQRARQREESDADDDAANASAEAESARTAAATADEATEAAEPYVAWAQLASRALTDRFLALLNFFEGLTVRMELAKKKLKETTQIGLQVPLLYPPAAMPMVGAGAHAARQTTVLGVSVAEFLLGHAMAGHHTDTEHDADVHAGDYTIDAKNVSVVARVDPPPVAAPVPGAPPPPPLMPEKSYLNLIAEGSGDGGIVNVIGTADVCIQQAADNRIHLTKDDGVEIQGVDGINLWTSALALTAPRLKMTSDSITLSVGNLLTGPRIVISDSSIKLMAGNTLTGSMIELTATDVRISQGGMTGGPTSGLVSLAGGEVGLQSQGVASVKVTPTSIKSTIGGVGSVDVQPAEVQVNGLKINMRAELGAVWESMLAENHADAVYDLVATLFDFAQ